MTSPMKLPITERDIERYKFRYDAKEREVVKDRIPSVDLCEFWISDAEIFGKSMERANEMESHCKRKRIAGILYYLALILIIIGAFIIIYFGFIDQTSQLSVTEPLIIIGIFLLVIGIVGMYITNSISKDANVVFALLDV